MEYVDGPSLYRIVGQQGPLSLTRAVHYIRQAALGLQHAHKIGLVHRDIKPGNLLVDKNNVVKILDMGLARFFQEEDELLTRGVLGTADYLAPEQTFDSHSVDIRADIYGLGGTFYFVLTGQPPFGEGSVAQKILSHRLREPTPISSFRPDIAPSIVSIVNRMMAKEPAHRYQTPAAVIKALDNWQ
jgi:serine/threonine protein kinase